jgi:hypothetical protein
MNDRHYFRNAGYGAAGELQDRIEECYQKEDMYYGLRSYDLRAPYTPDNQEINRKLRLWAYVEKTTGHTHGTSVKSDTNTNPDP